MAAPSSDPLAPPTAPPSAPLEPATLVTLKPIESAVHIGDEISLHGENLIADGDILRTVLFIGTVRVTQFNPGTNKNTLVFNVPPISDISSPIKVSVSNRHGRAETDITILPALRIVRGEIRITQLTAPAVNIVAGKTYKFPFALYPSTNVAETYRLRAHYVPAPGEDVEAWQTNTQLLDWTGSPISEITLSQDPGEVWVRVSVPYGRTFANMTLQAFSVSSPDAMGLNVASNPLEIKVGATPRISVPGTTFGSLVVDLSAHLLQDPSHVRVLELPADGTRTRMRIDAKFFDAGTYTYSARIVPDMPDIWQAKALSAATIEEPGSSQSIAIELRLLAPDTEPFRVLEIHATRTDATGNSLDSWFSIVVRPQQN